METITEELLSRIAERARDPKRRYMLASEDEARIELPLDEIERREEEWTRRNFIRSAAIMGRDMPAEDIERYMHEWRTSRDTIREEMDAQMRAWGQRLPTTRSLIETDDAFRVSSDPPGAKPLQLPPSESDWEALDNVVGRSVPEDLRRLYSISDGGFGPGFYGLNSVQLITAGCDDFRRRGPDYCNSISYPPSFIPLAGETLDYHYDLDTGRIISSNAHWENDDLDVEDIYNVEFQSLAALMEDWLGRS
ncbi:SMI1/KNR4 family protein [uncultured Erythrobacter sp.]|uniref:SMI1/KNR4 family protein n=1 Tax=uncultured Erythrobacter sp. TaxID=263913 RepID=UPI0026580102|nr:SMI1/KNR4 family protein [uncultured Erythrobacter sp.]